MRLALTAAAFLASTSLALADVKVMASIKPVHALVAQVMEGVGAPGLLVDGANSPHSYSFKPSDAAALQEADVIFWVGHGLEAFLEKPIEALGSKAATVELMEAPGVTTLPLREGTGFDAHDPANEGAADDHDHDHDAADAHIWLDPQNAKAMVTTIADTLAKADAAHAARYQANAAKALAQIDGLQADIAARLAPLKDARFIVFHDAFQYFENRFGLAARGSISINPENPPGAKGIAEIKARITREAVTCVFAEPQFDNKLVTLVLEGTKAKQGILDPLGATLEPGAGLYPALLNGLANNLTACLSP